MGISLLARGLSRRGQGGALSLGTYRSLSSSCCRPQDDSQSAPLHRERQSDGRGERGNNDD
jgi:hypothetical protein